MGMSHIPAGMQAITPYLIINNAARFLDFVRDAFGAKETFRMARPDGTIGHASVEIEGSVIELADATADLEPAPGRLHLYVPDADAVYAQALAAGGTSRREPADMFYGDREGDVVDPCGNHWFIATHKKDVGADELDKHAKELKGTKGA